MTDLTKVTQRRIWRRTHPNVHIRIKGEWKSHNTTDLTTVTFVWRSHPKGHIVTKHDWSDERHTRTNTRLLWYRSHQDEMWVIRGSSHNIYKITKVTWCQTKACVTRVQCQSSHQDWSDGHTRTKTRRTWRRSHLKDHIRKTGNGCEDGYISMDITRSTDITKVTSGQNTTCVTKVESKRSHQDKHDWSEDRYPEQLHDKYV